MRILGIDHGEKRIGLALSDPLGITAQGLPTLERRDEEADLAAIGDLISQHAVEDVVVGLPKNMDGTIGEQAERAMAFAEKLRARFGVAVHLIDERLTSVRAERVLREAEVSRKKMRGKSDRIAAQLILQAYLDRADKAASDTDRAER